MQIYRAIRLMILGGGIVIASLVVGAQEGGIAVQIIGSVVGLLLLGLGVLVIIRDVQRRRLENTPVPEAPDAGTFWRRTEQ
jgi:hypothetical protein